MKSPENSRLFNKAVRCLSVSLHLSDDDARKLALHTIELLRSGQYGASPLGEAYDPWGNEKGLKGKLKRFFSRLNEYSDSFDWCIADITGVAPGTVECTRYLLRGLAIVAILAGSVGAGIVGTTNAMHRAAQDYDLCVSHISADPASDSYLDQEQQCYDGSHSLGNYVSNAFNFREPEECRGARSQINRACTAGGTYGTLHGRSR